MALGVLAALLRPTLLPPGSLVRKAGAGDKPGKRSPEFLAGLSLKTTSGRLPVGSRPELSWSRDRFRLVRSRVGVGDYRRLDLEMSHHLVQRMGLVAKLLA